MKNIHVLPTDKPSRLVLDTVNKNLFLTTTKDFGTKIMQFQNIYITSSEEIKEGDWVINLKSNGVYSIFILNEVVDYEKKIILTTNQDLIKEGIQAIDDKFLEWFVQNPSCEYVDIFETYNQEKNACDNKCKRGCHSLFECENVDDTDLSKTYEIIPKEEPKQETLEEAALRRYQYTSVNPPYTIITPKYKIQGFIDGAKWQAERMYSEEEVKMLAFNFYYDMSHKMGVAENLISENRLNAEEWFEQFKKHKGGEQ